MDAGRVPQTKPMMALARASFLPVDGVFDDVDLGEAEEESGEKEDEAGVCSQFAGLVWLAFTIHKSVS